MNAKSWNVGRVPVNIWRIVLIVYSMTSIATDVKGSVHKDAIYVDFPFVISM